MTEFNPTLRAGQVEQALYENTEIPQFRGNPLIEALPPIIGIDNFYSCFGYYPRYDPSERRLPDRLRLYAMEEVRRLFVPLPKHWDLHLAFSRLLHMSYSDRNPIRTGYSAQINDRIAALNARLSRGPAGSSPLSFGLLGPSGIGKTFTMTRLLTLYPQVIKHTQYHKQRLNLHQIVYVKLECPENGSLRDLTTAFFVQVDALLGTSYYSHYCTGRASAMQMIAHRARVTDLHYIGVLVIDEIQKLSKARSQGAQNILDFFVRLINTINTAIVLVGTEEAEPVLSNRFSFARRSGGQGEFNWHPMEKNEVWSCLLEAVWEYQYTQQPFALTQEFIDVMHEVSGGIPDLAIKTYIAAQTRAVDNKREIVTPSLIRTVAKQQFPRALKALEQAKKRREANQRFRHSLKDEQGVQAAATSRVASPRAQKEQAHKRKSAPKETSNSAREGQLRQPKESDQEIEQARLKGDVIEFLGASK